LRIYAYCQECHRHISGKDGVVHARERDFWERGKIRKEVAREQDALNRELGLLMVIDGEEVVGGNMSDLIKVDQLADRIPAPVKWEVHCDDCNPHEGPDGTYCEGCYWAGLIHWQKHLSEKDWFEDTDWFDHLLPDLDNDTRAGLRFLPPVKRA
jgi:hypothetical protein